MKYIFTIITLFLSISGIDATEIHKISKIESRELHGLLKNENYTGFIDFMNKHQISGDLFVLNSNSWLEATYGAEEVIETSEFIILKGNFWISNIRKKIIEKSKTKGSYVKIDRKKMKIIELGGKYEGTVMHFLVLDKPSEKQ